MVKPSPALYARLRFSTKQVAKGFYRGNRTGSMGAHTQYGGYLIDWRKVRNYNAPDLKDFELTPYVSKDVNPKDFGYDDPFRLRDDVDKRGQLHDTENPIEDLSESDAIQRLKKRVMPVLHQWRKTHPNQFASYVKAQYEERTKGEEEARQAAEAMEYGDTDPSMSESIRQEEVTRDEKRL